MGGRQRHARNELAQVADIASLLDRSKVVSYSENILLSVYW